MTLLSSGVFAQADAPADPNSNTSATPTPAATPTPIAVASVLSEAEAVSGRLKIIRSSLDDKPAISSIDSQLPNIRQEIDNLDSETRRVLADSPSLDEIRNTEQEWQPLSERLAGWSKTLQEQTLKREKDLAELARMTETWTKTLSSFKGLPSSDGTNSTVSPDAVPNEVLQKVNEVIADIKSTTDLTEQSQKQLLAFQTRVTSLESRVNSALSDTSSIRDQVLSDIFQRDSPPIWSVLDSSSLTSGNRDAGASINDQTSELRTYAASRVGRFILHGLLFVIIASLLFWARGWIKPHVEAETKLETAAQVFAMPIVTALVISIVLSAWFYPQAPQLLRSLIGLAGLVPAVILLRRLVGPSYHLLLNAMVVFFVLDRIRGIFPDHSALGRVIFLAEMAAAVIFLVWVIKSKKFTKAVEAGQSRTIESLKKAVPFLIGIFAAAFLAQLIGYVNLANLVGNGILASSYAALVIYAAVRIFQGIVIFALRMKPLSLISVVRNNRPVIREAVFRIIRWVAVIIWVLVVLNLFSLQQYIFEQIKYVASLSLPIGSIEISLGDIAVFAITLWVAVMISRFLQFVLNEELYPRWAVGRGASYAISTTLHYAIIVIGFLIAVSALGVDFTKFAIIAGAIGVGIGFGLQTIINNFVSGLILLFERPIKVGDTIQINEHTGSLREIGLRASVLRKVDGSDVIVPNSMLVAEQVVNWTMSDTKRRIDIPVGVAYGTDPKIVQDILYKIATSKPDILVEPAPRVLFSNLGASSIDFELRVWVDDPDKLISLRSELVTDTYNALNEAGIEIPFPQQDLHLRSIDETAARILVNKE